MVVTAILLGGVTAPVAAVTLTEVTGVVKLTDGTVVENALVSLYSGGGSTRTDAAGKFAILANPTMYDSVVVRGDALTTPALAPELNTQVDLLFDGTQTSPYDITVWAPMTHQLTIHVNDATGTPVPNATITGAGSSNCMVPAVPQGRCSWSNGLNGTTDATGTFITTVVDSTQLSSPDYWIRATDPALTVKSTYLGISSITADTEVTVELPGLPGAPASVDANAAGETSADLLWLPPLDDGGSPITGYEIVATPEPTLTTGAVRAKILAATLPAGSVQLTVGPEARAATLTGLESGTSYSVSVAAVNAIGRGAEASISVTTGPRAALTPTFSIPVPTRTGFTVNVTNYDPDFDFSASTSVGVLSVGTPTGATLPLTVSKLGPGATAIVTVRVDRIGYASGTGQVTGSAKPGAPSAPQGVQAVAGRQSALVSWSAPSSDGGAAIVSYQATAYAAAKKGKAVKSCTWSGGPLTCTVEGLAAGTTYYISVKASNAFASGPESSPRVRVDVR